MLIENKPAEALYPPPPPYEAVSCFLIAVHALNVLKT